MKHTCILKYQKMLKMSSFGANTRGNVCSTDQWWVVNDALYSQPICLSTLEHRSDAASGHHFCQVLGAIHSLLYFFSIPNTDQSDLDCWEVIISDKINVDVWHFRRLNVSHAWCAGALSSMEDNVTDDVQTLLENRTIRFQLYLTVLLHCQHVCFLV